MDTTYNEIVKNAEAGLADYAQKSFSADSPQFLNGTEIQKHFTDLWKTSSGRLKLANRTPLQLERDRILYSPALRKQTEKYHVLYSGSRRITRNYTTHTMRMAHVTRAICKGLRLNSDFAEGIAIGSKVGAAPFIHVTKSVANDWLTSRLTELSTKQMASNPQKKPDQRWLFPEVQTAAEPAWLSQLQARDVFEQASQYIPCAVGDHVDAAYHSGSESYWLLCTNPYLRESARAFYHPETMHGIWRHTRTMRPRADAFFHRCAMSELNAKITHQITWRHSTFEGMAVQFADDMTWIIENLNDANDAALLSGSQTNLFLQLKNSLGEIPPELSQPLVEADAGGLYTYFITDFVNTSRAGIGSSGVDIRAALQKGDSSALIGPSPDAQSSLERMKLFLEENVFKTARIKSRNRMLESVGQVCLDLLYDRKEGVLNRLIGDRANLENWPNDKRGRAEALLSEDVHRAQLAVDTFAGLGDQEVFELVGIQAF